MTHPEPARALILVLSDAGVIRSALRDAIEARTQYTVASPSLAELGPWLSRPELSVVIVDLCSGSAYDDVVRSITAVPKIAYGVREDTSLVGAVQLGAAGLVALEGDTDDVLL